MTGNVPHRFTTIFSLFLCILSNAQDHTSKVQDIKEYVRHIDSVNSLGAQDNGFLHFVDEGVIAKKSNRKILGGYSV
jgi:hypothetical protein